MKRAVRLFVFLLAVLAGAVPIGGADADADAKLAKSLTLHASFDTGPDADFSRGDKTCYVQRG
jgi:hypothetical protein